VPWGSDPGSAHRFGFVAVRLRSATLCGCDPLAEGSLAGADAMRPASRISIAALCAPSRTVASRTGSGAHPRSAGPLLRASPNPAPPYAGAPRCRLCLV
jgi:hypothetical protein